MTQPAGSGADLALVALNVRFWEQILGSGRPRTGQITSVPTGPEGPLLKTRASKLSVRKRPPT